MHKTMVIFIVLSLLLGCTRTQVIQTGNEVTGEYQTTDADAIEIYRSTNPSWKFFEIGIISLHEQEDIATIFKEFRIEAAKRGANGIINFDIDSESKMETVTKTETVYKMTSTVVQGDASALNTGDSSVPHISQEAETVTVKQNVLKVFYSVSGTLVRKIMEEK